MNLEIITPDKKLFKGEINAIRVPGTKGSFTVLTNHAAIISTLIKGTITITTTYHTDEDFEINGGIIEVNDNKIIVLIDM